MLAHGLSPRRFPDRRGAQPCREGAPGPRRPCACRAGLRDSGTAQGWCQYGSPGELPGIKHKREDDKDPPPPPDWRITCLFIDKRHRGQGIARAALKGAPGQIAHLGGGLAEAISEVTAARQAQGRFPLSATVELFEQNGFTRVRQAGKHPWIVSKVIQPA